MMRRLGCARWTVSLAPLAPLIRGLLALVVALGPAVSAGVAATAAAGCGKRASEPSGPPPEVTGLAAVPVDAEVVVGADVAKLAGSPVLDRLIEQLMLHSPALGDRWGQLKDSCKIDLVKQVKHVMLATGPHAGTAPGTGPVVMVVVGSVPEADLKECVGKLVGSGGGTVTGKPLYGRTLYVAKSDNTTTYFAYGKPDTVVLGASEDYVTEALGSGKKAPDNPELGKLLGLVDQRAPLWAVGRVDPRVRDGLAELTKGAIHAGPTAFTLTSDLSDGLSLQLSAVMASADDAKALESYVKGNLALLTAAAQWKSLGSVVGKISVTAEQEIVRFRAQLSIEDLNRLQSVLDGEGSAAQDPAPSTHK